MKKSLSPEQNLMMAIYGSLKPSREQVEKVRDKLYEMQANSVTAEEFEKIWGVSIEEHTRRTMLWCGWLEAITDWNMKHGNERKYHVLRSVTYSAASKLLTWLRCSTVRVGKMSVTE